jgi:hypothetical protein
LNRRLETVPKSVANMSADDIYISNCQQRENNNGQSP